jgi:hypothetical protein
MKSSPLVPRTLSVAASAHLDLIRAAAASAVMWGHLRTLFFVDFQHLRHSGAVLKVIYISYRIRPSSGNRFLRVERVSHIGDSHQEPCLWNFVLARLHHQSVSSALRGVGSRTPVRIVVGQDRQLSVCLHWSLLISVRRPGSGDCGDPDDVWKLLR